jgi:hypothetical protein
MLGRRLYPDRHEIYTELDGVIKRIESVLPTLQASNVDGNALTELEFAAQVLADLNIRLGFDR